MRRVVGLPVKNTGKGGEFHSRFNVQDGIVPRRRHLLRRVVGLPVKNTGKGEVGEVTSFNVQDFPGLKFKV